MICFILFEKLCSFWKLRLSLFESLASLLISQFPRLLSLVLQPCDSKADS